MKEEWGLLLGIDLVEVQAAGITVADVLDLVGIVAGRTAIAVDADAKGLVT